MSNPIIKIVDASSGEEIEREMNDKELKEYNAFQAKLQKENAEAQAQLAARQSALEKLAALGLTEAEIQALAG